MNNTKNSNQEMLKLLRAISEAAGRMAFKTEKLLRKQNLLLDEEKALEGTCKTAECYIEQLKLPLSVPVQKQDLPEVFAIISITTENAAQRLAKCINNN